MFTTLEKTWLLLYGLEVKMVTIKLKETRNNVTCMLYVHLLSILPLMI